MEKGERGDEEGKRPHVLTKYIEVSLDLSERASSSSDKTPPRDHLTPICFLEQPKTNNSRAKTVIPQNKTRSKYASSQTWGSKNYSCQAIVLWLVKG